VTGAGLPARSATSTCSGLAAAREFYVDAIGFETTPSDNRGALFVSAGGYHDHLAMNVWHSRGRARGRRASGWHRSP
jgi:catechol 2,3-dioxygenase